jgi:hypothetical protein
MRRQQKTSRCWSSWMKSSKNETCSDLGTSSIKTNTRTFSIRRSGCVRSRVPSKRGWMRRRKRWRRVRGTRRRKRGGSWKNKGWICRRLLIRSKARLKHWSSSWKMCSRLEIRSKSGLRKCCSIGLIRLRRRRGQWRRKMTERGQESRGRRWRMALFFKAKQIQKT